MPRARLALCALAAVLLSAGCNRDDMIRKFATAEDEKVARVCIDTLRKGRLDEIEARLHPSIDRTKAHGELVKMLAAVPPGEPDAVKLIGVHKNINNGVRSADLVYQYTYGKKYLEMGCITISDGPQTILGIEVRPLPASYDELSRFVLTGKSFFQYLVLLAGVVFIVMSLLALIRCIVDRNLRRKWLWILFILFGIGKLSMDWNTGAWDFHPLYFLLFSVSADSPGYGWTVSIALPVGAAVYLARRALNHRAASRSNDG